MRDRRLRASSICALCTHHASLGGSGFSAGWGGRMVGRRRAKSRLKREPSCSVHPTFALRSKRARLLDVMRPKAIVKWERTPPALLCRSQQQKQDRKIHPREGRETSPINQIEDRKIPPIYLEDRKTPPIHQIEDRKTPYIHRMED